MRHSLLLVLLSGLLLGCAQNAILEITITLPTSTAAADRVEIGFQSSAAMDPAALSPNPSDQHTFVLPSDGEALERVSVVASAGDVELPLWLSVRYCSGSCGLASADSTSWVRYERPFYVGEYTEHDLTLPRDMAPTLEVGVCEVYGCLSGTRPPDGACIHEDGRHACASSPAE